MAIFCLTESWADLKRRIGDIVIGYSRAGPVTARDLGADGAMAVLLRDALAPNLVQTLGGRPGLRARRAVRQHRPRVQLGGRDPGRPADRRTTSSRRPVSAPTWVPRSSSTSSAASRAASRRCGRRRDGARAEVPRRRGPGRPRTEDLPAVETGHGQPARHCDNIRNVYGVPCVVAINRFPTDTEAEIAGSSSWWRRRACRRSPRRTSTTAAPAPRSSPRACWLPRRAVAVRVLLHLSRRAVPGREGRGDRDPACTERRR